MKLVIAGSSGFVATECIRQALSNPRITTVVALGRKAVSPPSNLPKYADTTKLVNVILKDYETYDDDARKALEGVEACIWYFPTLSTLSPFLPPTWS
jgi:hypothetical protein